jgi:phospholipase/lecithinase/hemolysin
VGFFLGLGPFILPAQSAFTSLYVFGDGVSTTTNNTPGGGSYYQQRYCNGRVWVEVLAQRQGLAIGATNNCSYFGQSTTELLKNINNKFTPPPDVATTLFVVWVCDADLVLDVNNYEAAPGTYSWATAINQSQANHLQAIQNLYAMGARTLIMPNAVDLTKVPFYSQSSGGPVIRQQITNYNNAFAITLSNAMASLPGLVIYQPDFFSLLDDIVANSTNYGLTRPNSDALDDGYLNITNAVADQYVFWDYQDPSAKAHCWMADLVQQLISPLRISKLTLLSGSNRLDVVNLPIGQAGFADGSTDLVNWTDVQSIATNSPQTIFVPAASAPQFYRLRFPFAWTWP